MKFVVIAGVSCTAITSAFSLRLSVHCSPMQNASTYFHIVHAVHMLMTQSCHLLTGFCSANSLLAQVNCLLYSGARCSDRPIISLVRYIDPQARVLNYFYK